MNCTRTQNAICAATSDFIWRRRECESSPLSALMGFTAEARKAGVRPKRSVTKRARPTLNPNARQSASRISRIGSFGRASMDTTHGADQDANNAPAVEARTASIALSTSTSWIRRRRPAPIETRKAISRARVEDLGRQQISDIGAGNQEYESHQHSENQERPAEGPLKIRRARGCGLEREPLAQLGVDRTLGYGAIPMTDLVAECLRENDLQCVAPSAVQIERACPIIEGSRSSVKYCNCRCYILVRVNQGASS